MLEKTHFGRSHAINAVIAMLVVMLFTLAYGNVMPAYAADEAQANTEAGSKLTAGETGAIIVATNATKGNYKPMTLENAKGTVHLYPILYDKANKYLFLDYQLNSSSETDDEPTYAKSSNKKVCIANPGYGSLGLEFNWTGKSTVSYTWKGKAHKVTFVVHKWTNPLKSLVVGGRQYVGKYKKSNTFSMKSKYITGKVKVKAAKGWKVSYIESVKANLSAKKIKNGKTTLKSKDKVRGLIIRLKNKASGQEIWVDLCGKGFLIPL